VTKRKIIKLEDKSIHTSQTEIQRKKQILKKSTDLTRASKNCRTLSNVVRCVIKSKKKMKKEWSEYKIYL
jgi:galactokinase